MATPTEFDAAVYRRLIERAHAAGNLGVRWLLLEAAGQLMRLLLVPLGHVTGRLPIGNPGRATVRAFAPMPVRPELAALMAAARHA